MKDTTDDNHKKTSSSKNTPTNNNTNIIIPRQYYNNDNREKFYGNKNYDGNFYENNNNDVHHNNYDNVPNYGEATKESTHPSEYQPYIDGFKDGLKAHPLNNLPLENISSIHFQHMPNENLLHASSNHENDS